MIAAMTAAPQVDALSKQARECARAQRLVGGALALLRPGGTATRLDAIAVSSVRVEVGGNNQGRASSTRLNGVSAARRKRVKPPSRATRRKRPSPACAPKAMPSAAMELGTHSNVDAA